MKNDFQRGTDMNSNYTEHTLTEAIDGLRMKMKMEHDPAWQAGVHALVQEMMLTAAQTAIQRAERARSEFYGALVPLLPEPAQEPVPLYSEPTQANGHHYADPFEDEPYENPMFMQKVAK